MPVPGNRRGFKHLIIPDVASAILFIVGIEEFRVKAPFRGADPVIM